MRLTKYLRPSSDRTAIIVKNSIYGIGLKGVSISISLLLVPMTINYVSSELYGIWLTLSSIITWLSFFDIGFGLGMRNRLTEAISLKRYDEARIYVSTTYFVLSAIFGILGLSGFVGFAYIDWCSLLNVSSEYQDILITASRILLVSFCVNIVLQLIQNVYQAHQKTAIASLISTLGSAISLLLIYILTKTTFPNLSLLASVFCLSPITVTLIISVVKYAGTFSYIRPSLSHVKLSYAKDIFNLGAKFFLLQIVCIILYQATNFIISHYCGPEQVTVYNVAYKYLNCAIMLLGIITTPIWSAYTDAFAKGDFEWMKSLYSRMLKMNGLLIIGIILMVIISPIVYQLWIGDSVTVPISISILIGTYNIFLSISNMHSTILCGMGKIKLQVFQALAQGIVYIPTVILFAKSYSTTGILIALIISSIIPVVFLTIQVNLLLNQKAKGIWNK